MRYCVTHHSVTCPHGRRVTFVTRLPGRVPTTGERAMARPSSWESSPTEAVLRTDPSFALFGASQRMARSADSATAARAVETVSEALAREAAADRRSRILAGLI